MSSARHTAPPPPAPPAPHPTHLLVLVNGLWGWQRDWHRMAWQLRRAGDATGRCLVHVSAANEGVDTYAGIDVCGQRLAAEVRDLAAAHPSLTDLSFMGHSMGGLIARFAVGLLAEPAQQRVAGLAPAHFVAIATPHLGCSSTHADEVHWQDRPWMRWLAAAVSGGHLGGHEHLATGAGSTAVKSSSSDEQQPQQQQEYRRLEEQQQQQPDGKTSSGGSSRSWPWAAVGCRSVVQLLGCDAWHGLPVADSDSSDRDEGSCNCSRGSSAASVQHKWTVRFVSGTSDSKALAQGLDPPVSLLDCLAGDVELVCRACGLPQQQRLHFLSGLRLFQHRATYSSAGGDHLIPWASSSLLPPEQLVGGEARLPALPLLATKPAIVEQQAPSSKQQEPELEPASAAAAPDSSAAGQGVLAARLARLQTLDWRRFHVVWPPLLCFGSRHCNIQFNGPLNFVGQAVVEHVTGLVMGEQA